MRPTVSGRCLIKRRRHKERLRPPHHPPLLQGPGPAAEQEAEHGAAAAAGGEEPPSGPHRRSPYRVAKGSRGPAHNAIKRDVPKLEAKDGDPPPPFFWIFSIFITFPPPRNVFGKAFEIYGCANRYDIGGDRRPWRCQGAGITTGVCTNKCMI